MNFNIGEASIVKIALTDYISQQELLLLKYRGREESSFKVVFFGVVKTKAEYISDIENRLKRAKTALNKMNDIT